MAFRKPARNPIARIAAGILFVRGHKVMVDSDLAEVYGVTTKRLNEQVKRNHDRFPADFVFQLTKAEKAEVVAECDHLARLKFSPTLPMAFTEHGAIMAASVLNSPRAVEMSVFVVRAFVRLRESSRSHADIATKVADLERRVAGHDEDLKNMFGALRKLLGPPADASRRRIGFRTKG
jgi:hypothetical protein